MRWLLALLALLLIGAAPRDWTRTVTATPEGGFRMGNPAAKVKLVEYASLTCPHCRDFHAAAMPTLKRDYVAKGLVSYEYRSFVLNAPDAAASMIARCGGAAKFFARVDYFFREQTNWVRGFQSISQGEQQRIGALPEGQQIAALGQAAKLPAFTAARGLPAAQAVRCLQTTQLFDQLSALRDRGAAENVVGTPTFFINGRRSDVFDWPRLQPQLRAALSN